MSEELKERVTDWIRGNGIQLVISKSESGDARRVVYYKNIYDRFRLGVIDFRDGKFEPDTEPPLKEAIHFAVRAMEDLPDSVLTHSLVAYVAEKVFNEASRLQEAGQEFLNFLQNRSR